ncbi:hypothetical protein MMA231_00991 [Asticcacaulis sp. MM231]|uniref:hypothetical protein n=1 Tax=Asticcacaulis sp. MM231 TaxID=3157666 RepID=UPI0032D5A54D
MTIIAGWTDPKTSECVCVADILLTRPTPGEEALVDLPFTGKRPEQLGVHHAGGMGQKLILLTPNDAILWAGSQIVAHAIIDAVREALALGRDFLLSEIIKEMGLAQHEVEAIALIYYKFRTESGLSRNVIHAERVMKDDLSLAYAGSGKFDFISNMAIALPDGTSMTMFNRALSYVCYTSLAEQHDDDPKNFAYGGWFEICRFGGYFQKVPYRIHLWSMESGKLSSGAVLEAWYVGHDLFIRRFNTGGRHDALFHLSDPLRREQITFEADINPTRPPKFQYHSFFDAKGISTGMVMPGDSPDCYVNYGSKGREIHINQAFLDEAKKHIDADVKDRPSVSKPFNIYPG